MTDASRTTDSPAGAGGAATVRRPVPLGILAMVVAVLSFSLSSPLIKWSESTGSVIAFWRMAGAVVAWWTVVTVSRVRTGRPWPSPTAWRAVLPPALFFGANIAVFFTAITRTSIAHAEFIAALNPLVLLPAGALLFDESPNWRALRWGALSIVGVSMVLFLGPDQGAASTSGDLLMILVVTLWTSYLLMSKRARASGVDTLDFMACLMPLGLLTAGPIAVLIAGSDVFGLTARGWLVVVLLTFMTGMVSHGCIVFAQRLVPVATIGIMQSGQPALATFWGFVILGETVLAPQVVGMALVVTGLALFTWSSQRRLPAPPAVAATPPRADPTAH